MIILEEGFGVGYDFTFFNGHYSACDFTVVWLIVSVPFNFDILIFL